MVNLFYINLRGINKLLQVSKPSFLAMYIWQKSTNFCKLCLSWGLPFVLKAKYISWKIYVLVLFSKLCPVIFKLEAERTIGVNYQLTHTWLCEFFKLCILTVLPFSLEAFHSWSWVEVSWSFSLSVPLVITSLHPLQPKEHKFYR